MLPKLSNCRSFSHLDLYPDFKITILFNVKQLENGTRYSYSYNGPPIESHTWSIERPHFE